jgi:hypothetical protein
VSKIVGYVKSPSESPTHYLSEFGDLTNNADRAKRAESKTELDANVAQLRRIIRQLLFNDDEPCTRELFVGEAP